MTASPAIARLPHRGRTSTLDGREAIGLVGGRRSGNPERFRFCGVCDVALGGPGLAGGDERKVVSVLFVDLVGFTARSDQADPEDVQARLRPYHSTLKREIELLGGTVEKFIGDAVMAVFGAPVAHEDDAERRVRAALRIVEAIEHLIDEHPGLDLSVRWLARAESRRVASRRVRQR